MLSKTATYSQTAYKNWKWIFAFIGYVAVVFVFLDYFPFSQPFLGNFVFRNGMAQWKYVGFKKNLSCTQYISVVKCIIDAFLDTFNCFIPLHFTPDLNPSHFCLLFLAFRALPYYVATLALLPHTEFYSNTSLIPIYRELVHSIAKVCNVWVIKRLLLLLLVEKFQLERKT